MIITSLLDTDLYKLTLMQLVRHQFPSVEVEYKFKCRNAELDPTSGQSMRPLGAHADEIRAEISALCQLHYGYAELAFLRSLRFIKLDFVDFLRFFKLDEKYITVSALPSGELDITIRGPWLHTILFEVPVLAIVNEVYFRHRQAPPDLTLGRQRLDAKVALLRSAGLKQLKIADYGTRPRCSAAWHEEVLRRLQAGLGSGQLAGTSNLLLAMKLGLTPLGTMAHEFLQACQALAPRLSDSQHFAFESWALEYRGDLGIALSDVYGMNAFLRDFDRYFCKLFDGVRHDSGEPLAWAERVLEHYRCNRIDPRSKTLVFSKALSVARAVEIYQQLHGRCQLGFGIASSLTNDLGDAPAHVPLQSVIKMVRCNGQPVANLSDPPARAMCDDEIYLAHLRQVFDMAESA